MLSLDIAQKGLVLPQLDMPGFVDSLWEVLPFKRSGWGSKPWEEAKEVGAGVGENKQRRKIYKKI